MRSVLGRFLEHSRLFIFERPTAASSIMGSADLMPRNLDHRVEVVTPVEDLALQSELASTFEALWRDTASSFELDADGQLAARPAEEGRTAALRPADADAPRAAARLARRAR